MSKVRWVIGIGHMYIPLKSREYIVNSGGFMIVTEEMTDIMWSVYAKPF